MELCFQVNKSPEFIFDYLTDMQKFVSVHPVIAKIEVFSENKYLAHETLKFGFIPVSFRYFVTIEADPDKKTVSMQATVMRFTKIELQFKLTEGSELCEVTEIIHFKSPFPVKRMMGRIFRKQHGILFENIGRLKDK